MAKLIGTGKDPRFPKGQDYDVPEQELQHHIDAQLGDPVEPGFEASAVHRGRDTIAEDQLAESDPIQGRPPTQEELGFSSRVAARVETTAGSGSEMEDAESVVKAKREDAEETETVGEGEDPELSDEGRASTRTGEEVQGKGEDAVGNHPKAKRERRSRESEGDSEA